MMRISAKKRKSTAAVAAAGAIPANVTSVHDIFKKNFEAQFAPLPEPVRAPEPELKDEEEDGWNGVDDGDDGDSDGEAVEVVDYSTSTPSVSITMSKHERKAFMSNKPIDLTASSISFRQPTTADEDDSDPEDSATLLKQDIELQRLLNESHLLASPTARLHVVSNIDKPFAEGKLRRKTTDMRVQALYHSAGSTISQENIPMNIRKGRAVAQAAREDKRRKEAKENGIVLARLGGDKSGVKKRKKGGAYAGPRVDMPGVGKMRGSELRVSEREARRMESPKRSFGRNHGGKGGRGKR